ncbi:hypothetical protein BKA66DRAFT_446027 [Pyrenochaeta sp. MPI-SDFR-AT-0127]|nr:hypothetical protein BKA66DRAFT_446027 [Pyrenochaeta sp. MPI-SDFR-AT-0127]
MAFSSLRRIALAVLISNAAASPAIKARGEQPQYFKDPSTTQYCTWYHDNADNSVACADIPTVYGISQADWLRWNPTVGSNCAGYNSFQSYCVEAFGEQTGSPVPTPGPSGTTNTPIKPSSTGNGITTPAPTQPGMVNNCNKFYKVVDGDGCDTVLSKNGISFADFYKWNAGVGDNCQTLWKDTYFCVGVIGFTPTPTPTTPPKTTAASTSRAPTNGVTTPTPTQPGLVSNCNRFYFAKVGESCADVLKNNGITLADFAKWNTGVGSNCQNMWGDTYHCVRVIGFTPLPSSTVKPPVTTTKPGNGITTPTPTQVGMVGNCNKFEYVDENEYCYDITMKYKITQENFVKWNPAAKSDCSGLWAKTYACVGVIS